MTGATDLPGAAPSAGERSRVASPLSLLSGGRPRPPRVRIRAYPAGRCAGGRGPAVRRLCRIHAARPPARPGQVLSHRRLADADPVRRGGHGAGPDGCPQGLELPAQVLVQGVSPGSEGLPPISLPVEPGSTVEGLHAARHRGCPRGHRSLSVSNRDHPVHGCTEHSTNRLPRHPGRHREHRPRPGRRLANVVARASRSLGGWTAGGRSRMAGDGSPRRE
jgi:hypothetical protein